MRDDKVCSLVTYVRHPRGAWRQLRSSSGLRPAPPSPSVGGSSPCCGSPERLATRTLATSVASRTVVRAQGHRRAAGRTSERADTWASGNSAADRQRRGKAETRRRPSDRKRLRQRRAAFVAPSGPSSRRARSTSPPDTALGQILDAAERPACAEQRHLANIDLRRKLARREWRRPRAGRIGIDLHLERDRPDDERQTRRRTAAHFRRPPRGRPAFRRATHCQTHAPAASSDQVTKSSSVDGRPLRFSSRKLAGVPPPIGICGSYSRRYVAATGPAPGSWTSPAAGKTVQRAIGGFESLNKFEQRARVRDRHQARMKRANSKPALKFRGRSSRSAASAAAKSSDSRSSQRRVGRIQRT